MVKTRSHKTFDDLQVIKEQPAQTKKENINIDSESDSDEAPEEESVSATRKTMIKKQKDQEKIMKKKRDEAKAKHKEIDERRKIGKLEKEIRELEKQRKELNNIPDEIPDELPEELLETIEFGDNDHNGNKETERKRKIVFNDTEEDEKLMKVKKRKNREERLTKLRELRSKTEKEVDGGIHVKILGSKNSIGSPNNTEITKRRSQWLMRKGVRRE